MNKLSKIFWSLILLGVCLSCSDKEEWETYRVLELDIEGIELPIEIDEFHLKGEIDAGGADFKITGVGADSKVAYVTSVEVNGVRQYRVSDYEGDGPYLQEMPSLEGEWGKITYLTKTPPYVMEFHIAPNESAEDRIMEFQIGYGYSYKRITLIQNPVRYKDVVWRFKGGSKAL